MRVCDNYIEKSKFVSRIPNVTPDIKISPSQTCLQVHVIYDKNGHFAESFELASRKGL